MILKLSCAYGKREFLRWYASYFSLLKNLPNFQQKPFFLVWAIKSAEKYLTLKNARKPFFGPLKWWWPVETLLGLDVAHRTLKLLSPVVHEHCTKNQNGTPVKKVLELLFYINIDSSLYTSVAIP